MICLLFTESDSEMISLLTETPYRGVDYKNHFANARDRLTGYIQADWDYLKNILSINDEKMLQIIQYVGL